MADEQQRVEMLSAAPSNGSRTVTITETNAQTTQPASTSTSGTLHLRAASGNDSRRVAWSEETVDNEGMGRKKSKICCIYHKPKAFDESSDESDEDSDESASSDSSRSSTASGVNASKELRAKRAATTVAAAAAEQANQTSTDNGHQHDDGCTPNHSRGTRKGKKSTSHRHGARSGGGGSRTLTELAPPTEADHDGDGADGDREPGKPKSNAYERGPA